MAHEPANEIGQYYFPFLSEDALEWRGWGAFVFRYWKRQVEPLTCLSLPLDHVKSLT